MQDNRRENEKDVDLTGMIHEYSQDNELRKKIEEMKRQKEAEKNAPSEKAQETYHSELFDDIRPANTFTNNNNMTDIRVDQDDIEKTRVGFQDHDVNKTLVIMDGKKATSFGTPEETFQTDMMEDESYDDDDEYDDLDKTIVQPVSEVNDVHTLDLDDEEEYEDEPEGGNKDKKQKDGKLNDTKMNKIITFVIIGLVAVVVLVGGFFGVKALMGGSSAASDKKTETTTKTDTDKDKDKEEEEPKTDVDEDQDQSDKNIDVSNNEAKIASLNQQIKNLETDIEAVNKKIESAQKDYDDANAKLQTLLDDSTKKQNEAYAYYTDVYTPKKAAKEQAEKAMEGIAETDPNYAALSQAKEVAELEEDKAEAEFERLDEIAKAANDSYKNSPYTTTANTAQGKLTELNSQKETLQKKIDDAKAELAKLQ